ncbi:MAG TPA: O-antigen ligase family protein [Candidatus Binatia bacterium]|jgi:O-antigen ligase|nr:O-antigen ligase family protein [Candidatus Binatia bacterium]
MYLRALAILLGVALLRGLISRFRPSLYGLTFGLFFVYLPLLQRIPLNLAPGVNLVTLFLVALLCLRPAVDDLTLAPSSSAFRTLLFVWTTVGVFGFIIGLAGSIPATDLFVLFKRWLDPLLFSLLALRLTRREDQHFLLACMLVGYGLVSLQGVREGLDIGHKQRIEGLIGQANELGAFLAMYAPVVLVSVLFLTKGLIRLVPLGLLVLGVTALVYTESRACLLALPIGLCALLWTSGRGGYGFVGLLLVTVIMAFPSLLPEKATERFEATYKVDSFGGEQLEESAASRLELWQGALHMASEYPLGIGFAQFSQEIRNYAHTNKKYASDAHNYYLLTWAEFGIMGLIVLLCLLSRMLVDAWALARHGSDHFARSLGLGLWAGLIAALFVNFFGTRLMDIQVSTYLWVLSAVAAAARDTVYEEDVETPEEGAPVRENLWGLQSYS